MVDLHPKICNLCEGEVVFTSNSNIYGRKYGSGFCYLCMKCGAYVGTHRPYPKEALGILASAEMRKWKMRCHDIFDSMWKNQKRASRKRRALYAWLAKKLDIPVSECHFGYFDLPTLRRAHKILLELWGNPLKYDNNGNIIN